ncbi:hypothetical protein U1Q18_028101, partial [Sarracenia purpurea var. burkii]
NRNFGPPRERRRGRSRLVQRLAYSYLRPNCCRRQIGQRRSYQGGRSGRKSGVGNEAATDRSRRRTFPWSRSCARNRSLPCV